MRCACLGALDQACGAQASFCKAASMRASDSSRPSAARVSQIPGDTVEPVFATGIGW
jgi:hypothetical protein